MSLAKFFLLGAMLLYSLSPLTTWAADSATRAPKASPAKSSTSLLDKISHALTAFHDLALGKHSQAARQTSQQSQQRKYHGLTVLGAGFPRTGTKSIEAALGHPSLEHKIYDTRSVLEHQHGQRWVEAARGWKLQNNNLTALAGLVQEIEYAGYTATLDMPLFFFAEPLAELRPQAKVLLSVRDSPEQWFDSFSFINTIFSPLMYCRPFIWFMPDLSFNFPVIDLVLGIQTISLRDNPSYVTRIFPWYDAIHSYPMSSKTVRQEWIQAYQGFVHEIETSTTIRGISTIGGAAAAADNAAAADQTNDAEIQTSANGKEDRLLIFNVKQGWEPLLDFLEINDSETRNMLLLEGFPHVNDRKVLSFVQRAIQVIGFAFPLWILIAFIVWLGTLRLVCLVLYRCSIWGATMAVSGPPKAKED